MKLAAYTQSLTLTELETVIAAPLILFIAKLIKNSADMFLSKSDIMQLHDFINSIGQRQVNFSVKLSTI